MEYKEIGDICTILSGYAFDSKQFTNDPQYFPLIRIRDIIRGRTDTYTKEKINEKYIVTRGDLLIGMDGEFNIGLWQSREAVLNQRVCKIWSSSNEITDRYLFYFLPKALKDIEKKTSFVTVKHLSVKSINEIKIPLPSIAIQQKIAHTLDTAAALLALRKQQLTELDALIQSVFIEMFGDPVVNEKGWKKAILKKSVDILSGHPFKSNLYTDDKTQAKLCGGLIIMPDKICWEKTNYYPNELVENLDKYKLLPDDIVMALDRPWISTGFKIQMIKAGEENIYLVQRTARIRGIKINQVFLFYLLKDSGFERHCRPTETTVPHISVNEINQYEVIIPPITFQTQFASIVEKIEQQKVLVQQAIDETQTLFDSLMAEYFE